AAQETTVTAGASEAPKAAPVTANTAAPSAAPAAAEPSPSPAAPETQSALAAAETEKELPISEESPLAQLWKTAQATGHPEIWGVTLADPDTHIPSQIVLQKYLNANDGDLVKAKDQLVKTLEWRAKMQPLELVKKVFNKAKFEGLGFVTTHGDDVVEPENNEIFTWNIYGGVKSIEETFGNVDEFIAWRVALMELALQELSLSTATKPITATEDPYKIFQVHDYKSISFLRSPPQVKSASAETIKVFAQNYPELLKEKFFVNVPAIMGFVYSFMKLFVAAKTIKKFHPMSNGGNLALEFADSKVKDLGQQLPAEYGGKGKDLKAQGKEPLL
ncbi:CRAL-TRIO domain-containing protein, partial [Immersiella caudata]